MAYASSVAATSYPQRIGTPLRREQCVILLTRLQQVSSHFLSCAMVANLFGGWTRGEPLGAKEITEMLKSFGPGQEEYGLAQAKELHYYGPYTEYREPQAVLQRCIDKAVEAMPSRARHPLTILYYEVIKAAQFVVQENRKEYDDLLTMLAGIADIKDLEDVRARAVRTAISKLDYNGIVKAYMTHRSEESLSMLRDMMGANPLFLVNIDPYYTLPTILGYNVEIMSSGLQKQLNLILDGCIDQLTLLIPKRPWNKESEVTPAEIEAAKVCCSVFLTLSSKKGMVLDPVKMTNLLGHCKHLKDRLDRVGVRGDDEWAPLLNPTVAAIEAYNDALRGGRADVITKIIEKTSLGYADPVRYDPKIILGYIGKIFASRLSELASLDTDSAISEIKNIGPALIRLYTVRDRHFFEKMCSPDRGFGLELGMRIFQLLLIGLGGLPREERHKLLTQMLVFTVRGGSGPATFLEESLPKLKMLLDEGAEPNPIDDRGNSLLAIAARDFSSAALVRLLIAAGADLRFLKNDKGLTAFQCIPRHLALRGEPNIETRDQLLEYRIQAGPACAWKRRVGACLAWEDWHVRDAAAAARASAAAPGRE